MRKLGGLLAEVGAMLVKAIECAVDNAEPETDVTAVTSDEQISHIENGPRDASETHLAPLRRSHD